MASMRRLRRRLLRWERYAARIGASSPAFGIQLAWDRPLAGHRRAFNAVEAETERRFWDETPEIWLGGPEGERALIADVLGDQCDEGDGGMQCPCGGDCWDNVRVMPAIETVTAFAERGLL